MENRTYIKTNKNEETIIAMIDLTKNITGKLPTKQEFFEGLKTMKYVPNDSFLSEINKRYPEIGVLN